MRIRTPWSMALATLLWLGCLAWLGCEEEPGPPSPEASASAEEEAPAAEASDEPESEAEELPPPTEGQRAMHDRYDAVERLRWALVDGALADAKDIAAELDRPVRDVDVPVVAQPLRDAVPGAARAIRAATTLDAATSAFADVMSACGSCHRTAEVSWSFDDPALPPEGDLSEHMRRHAWGIDRMWEALMLGSEERFDAGARVFADAPITGEAPPTEEDPQGLTELASELHRLGREASRVETFSERAALFGQMLSRCATCHARIAELDGVEIH